MFRATAALLGAVLIVSLSVACGAKQSPTDPSKLQVVAAEDVWGSLARQLGGKHVDVRSLITSPNVDPHDYEPSPSDARTMATAQLVVVNGIGYDSWADRLLAASPSRRRSTLDVGDLIDLRPGDNPHQWYAPAVVDKVVGAISAAYERLDSAHAADYRRLRETFETDALREYHSLIDTIRQRFAGVPVGASESIFTPLADALGLRLLTPERFLDAISEGNEPTASDTIEISRQLTTHEIDVFVLNTQNATPDVQRMAETAGQHGIPVVEVTETLTPPGATFEAWQVRQMRALEVALARATGR